MILFWGVVKSTEELKLFFSPDLIYSGLVFQVSGLFFSLQFCFTFLQGFPGGSDYKNLPAVPRFNLWVGKIPRRREWLPTPLLMPRKPHGQRTLVVYSPRMYACLVVLVMSDSWRPQGLQPTRLACPWAFLGKNTGVGSMRLESQTRLGD